MPLLPFLQKVKHEDQRVAVFLDIQNLYHSAKHLFKSRVNFKEVLKEATGGRKLIRAVGYVVRSGEPEEQAFFEALTHMGIETRIKDLQVFYGGLKKADWDVGLTLDAVSVALSVDVIVLASGDGDFVPLAERLKHMGKVVEVIAFGKSSSGQLKSVAGHFVDLGEDPRRFLLHK